MASTNTFRIGKRTNQACENCRRKKIRCPAERPSCSTCTRLKQACKYGGGNIMNDRQNENSGAFESRLMQLEEKMDMILEKTVSEKQAETPTSYLEKQYSTTDNPIELENSAPPSSIYSSLLPSSEVILEAIDLYFQYIHRQPIWIFEPEELLSPESCSEVVLFAVLSIALRYSPNFSFDKQDQTLLKYCDAARNLIMLKIANGNVELETLQSLCVVAYANFVDNDTQLARLHLTLASSLCRCAGLDTEQPISEHKTRIEAGRRIFWTIYLLEQIYGPRNRLLVLREDIRKPKYVTVREEPGRELARPPPATPEEPPYEGHPPNAGIWAYMPQMIYPWGQVRDYIIRCADGNTNPPWSRDSEYTTITSYLMGTETEFPSCHRYDAMRFSDRSVEELQKNRHYWGPWISIQFAYHVIHTILNHPFLYSSRSQQSSKYFVPNTFWKTSSELALLHATWISRLIDMASEKQFHISDPFLSYCAAVAGTVHFYHSRGAGSHHAQTARANLARCTNFINELSTRWPISRILGERLDRLVKSAFTSQKPTSEQSSRKTVTINAGLMWDILDWRTKPDASRSGLFHSSLCIEPIASDPNRSIMETAIPQTPATEVDTSNGGQALPPSWDSPADEEDNPGETVDGAVDDEATATLPWAQFDDIQSATAAAAADDDTFMELPYDPFVQFQDRTGPYQGWWEHGNF